MKIAHVIASLDSNRGGPSRSSLGLAKGLAKLDNQVELLTTDNEEKLDSLSGLAIRTFARGFPPSLSPSATLHRHLQQGDYQIVHHHGLWLRPLNYAHRAAERKKIPFVISPRGMMAPWAWSHHSGRKKLARRFVHPGAMEYVTGWHATSRMEADDILKLGFTQPICVSPNGVTVPSEQQQQIAREFWEERVPESKSRKIALFYSRLHSKKRIIELIDLWRNTAPSEWMLLIVGIPDQFSVEQLQAHILREGGKNRILVFDGTYKPPPYSVAHLMLLPSHSENFGLVVAESLAAGVPVITTTTTPWLELNQRDAGWCVDYGEFESAMNSALGETPEVLARRGALGKKWVESNFTWDVVAAKLHNFYHELHR